MSSSFLIVIVLIVAGLWLMIIRPQKRRQQAQQELLDNLTPGAEVVTAGGLYGTIRSVDDDEVKLEIAPGTEVRVAKRAVAAVIPRGGSELEELERAKREAEEEIVAGRRNDK